MKTEFWHFLLNNWQRKAIAVIAAIIIWFLVNSSITVTRTYSNIPIRIIDLPAGKTVEGLLPSGLLTERTAITLTGSKNVLQELNSSNLEVVLNARDKGDRWIARIDKGSLVSLNPELDLKHHISLVNANEFILTLSPLLTEKIPITLTKPQGDPPPGYQFLDVWPQTLYQSVSGPEKQVQELKSKGLELTFDLSEISASELDHLQSLSSEGLQDEISYIVPKSWLRIVIPFQGNTPQEINDPAAEHLRIDFLRRDFLPLEVPLPISVFFPLRYSGTLNPNTYSLATGELVGEENGISLLKKPLYIRDVSRLFLEVVRDSLEITLIVSPGGKQDPLQWSVEFINQTALENNYVDLSMSDASDKQVRELRPKLREAYLRNRFRNYIRQLELFTSPQKKLDLDIELINGMIILKEIT